MRTHWLAAGALLLAASPFVAAPAPLPRRNCAAPAVPVRCEMTWWGSQYCATFEPGGPYRASNAEGRLRYVGSWGHDRAAGVLVIRESYVHDDGTLGEERTYKIALRPGTLEGAVNGTAQCPVNFSLSGR